MLDISSCRHRPVTYSELAPSYMLEDILRKVSNINVIQGHQTRYKNLTFLSWSLQADFDRVPLALFVG